nr:hypothetical protein GCM10017583_07860 [Agromyces mediolanus]
MHAQQDEADEARHVERPGGLRRDRDGLGGSARLGGLHLLRCHAGDATKIRTRVVSPTAEPAPGFGLGWGIC